MCASDIVKSRQRGDLYHSYSLTYLKVLKCGQLKLVCVLFDGEYVWGMFYGQCDVSGMHIR